MKILYIGQYSKGTTSKMRADILQELLDGSKLDIINTNLPYTSSPKIWKSVGFRYKIGPLITGINNFVNSELEKLNHRHYDLVWIDKGIFLYPTSIKYIKKHTNKLVHYTPDMAFYANKSKKFEDALGFYDFMITTKTQEIPKYLERIPKDKLLITTQGYSKNLHSPIRNIGKKDGKVVFVGLAENSRFKIIEALITNNISVKLAGKGWAQFVQKNNSNPYLDYYGEGLFGQDYVNFISSASFGLGLLSKNFPELHTTRTFEIPACGTALLTEKNSETNSFFDDSNAIFFNNTSELIDKIQFYSNHKDQLSVLSRKGAINVSEKGFDYHSIIKDLLSQILG